MIPKRFIRVWVGHKPILELHEMWWQELKDMHPDYEFITIGNDFRKVLSIPDNLDTYITNAKNYAEISDILRLVSVYQLGGIYLDTDVMPIKKFDDLLKSSDKPFLSGTSSKRFENAVIGSPKGHIAFKKLLDFLPTWIDENENRSTCIRTGPTAISRVLFGRKDINHLPKELFYPIPSFCGPKRDFKLEMFKDKSNFSKNTIAAHFYNSRWGGKPHNEIFDE